MSIWNLIVTIDAGGEPIHLARKHMQIVDQVTGRTRQFKAALVDGEPPPISVEDTSFEFEVPREMLDIPALRTKGIRLPGAEAEVSMWRDGDDWSRRVILLLGRVAPNGVRRFEGSSRIVIDDYGAQSDRQFPPWKMTREGFAELPDNFRGRTMPVVYGEHVNAPMYQLDEITPTVAAIRMLVAGHRLSNQKTSVYPNGEESIAVVNQTILNGKDHVGGAGYSYVSMLTASEIQGHGAFVCTASGHAGQGGRVISGLGDVVDHAIRTYSGIESSRIDEERMSRFRSRANRIRVASLFGGNAGSTLIGTLRSRYESAFQVRFGWRGGRLGADVMVPDRLATPVRTLTYGSDLIDRIDPVQVGNDNPPYSVFDVEFDPDTISLTPEGEPVLRQVLRRDKTNDERCNLAHSRWGAVPFPTQRIHDVNTVGGAAAAIDWLVEMNAVQRTVVSYLARLDDVIRLPIFEVYGITDAEMGWTAERFRLDSIEPREDDLGLMVFTSVDEAP